MTAESSSPFLGFDSFSLAVESTDLTSQVEALARMLAGESVFLSGISGAGKSFVVSKFVSTLSDVIAQRGNAEPTRAIAVTGSTGLSAANIGGVTIHSLTGLFRCNEPIDKKRLYDSEYRKSVGMSSSPFFSNQILKDLEVIVVDEVSMLSGVFLDNMDIVLRAARKKNQPFGGVRMIFVGDFMQLPPVTKGDDVVYPFESQAWKDLDPKLLFLSRPMRSADSRLNRILSDMRNAKLSKESQEILKKCKRTSEDIENDEKIKNYVRLFTTNKNVDSYNARRLKDLDGTSQFFSPIIDTEFAHPRSPNHSMTDKAMERARKAAVSKIIKGDERVELKEKAVVTITHNLNLDNGEFWPVAPYPEGFDFEKSSAVNGDTGVVESIDPGVSVTIKLNRDGSRVRIGYINRKSEFGNPYLLSEVSPLSVSSIANNSGDDGVQSTESVLRDNFSVTFLPVRLSFAVTVHKSQGQTLHGTVVDLSQCFAPGLGYVALSRVASTDSLVIERIGRSAFNVSGRCMEMSKRVEQQAQKNREDFVEQAGAFESLLSNPAISVPLFWPGL